MLGRCGGVGMRALVLEGDTSRDLDGDCGGGLEGRSIPDRGTLL